MSLQFRNTTEILLYGIFDKDYAQELCNHTVLLELGTKLYEYPYVPLKIDYNYELPAGKTILEFRVDIHNCLDTLDTKWQEVLKNFCYEMRYVRNKIVDLEELDKQVLDLFLEESKKNGTLVKCIREAIIDGDEVYYGSRFKNRSYITYTIVNNTCIYEVDIYKYK